MGGWGVWVGEDVVCGPGKSAGLVFGKSIRLVPCICVLGMVFRKLWVGRRGCASIVGQGAYLLLCWLVPYEAGVD